MIELGFIFFCSLTALFTLRKVAKRIGLVDKPNSRKQHEGAVPLVGGIAVFVTIAQFIYTNSFIVPHAELLLCSIAALTVLGAIDDKFDISFKVRLVAQVFLAVIMMYFTEFKLNVVGDIIGIGNLEFGVFAPLLTVLAVLGAINAFNMVDGIDGLLGGISIVTFLSLGIVLAINGQPNLTFFCIGLVVALIPYVAFNMGWFGRTRRVFMGDAGSMMIGFTVIWLLLSASQAKGEPIIRPVTGLWIIGLPLMDMAAVMFRRVKRGNSPFKPDRDHLHHIFLRAGFGKYVTLITICLITALYCLVGILGELLAVPEFIMFFGFLVIFLLYSKVLTTYWPIMNKQQKEYTM